MPFAEYTCRLILTVINILLFHGLCLDWTVCAQVRPAETTVNVTGYYGYRSKRNITVMISNATWIDAFGECSKHDGKLDIGNNVGNPFLHLRNHLFIHHPQITGTHLWLGLQKPNLDDFWYQRGWCENPKNYTEFQTIDNFSRDQRQCLLLNMTVNTFSGIAHSWYAASCLEKHSFICAKMIGTLPMDEYTGMIIQNIETSTWLENDDDVTLEQCKQMCLTHNKCFYAVYNTVTRKCTRYKREIPHLPVQFTLGSADDNNTLSYVKSEENIVRENIESRKMGVEEIPDSTFTQTYSYADLPCYIAPTTQNSTTVTPSTIRTPETTTVETTTEATTTEETAPVQTTTEATTTEKTAPVQTTTEATTTEETAPVQTTTEATTTEETAPVQTTTEATTTEETAPVQTTTCTVTMDTTTSVGTGKPYLSDPEQIEQSLQKIRRDNTLDASTLSAFKNKFISAEDRRPSAKVMGFVGAMILTILCVVIVLSDISRIVSDTRTVAKCRKKNKESRRMESFEAK